MRHVVSRFPNTSSQIFSPAPPCPSPMSRPCPLPPQHPTASRLPALSVHMWCVWLPPRTHKSRGNPPIPYLLDHDAIGPRQLQPTGEVKGVHPAQDQGKDHDGQVGLNPRQVEGRRDNHQHRVDEATGQQRSQEGPEGRGENEAPGGGGMPSSPLGSRSVQ